MKNNLFTGKLVRLAVVDTKVFAEALHSWVRDSEYWRLMAADPAFPYSLKAIVDWNEKELQKESPEIYHFVIRTLEDDRLIGEIGLDGIQWTNGDAFVGISIGERRDWGKGYGTDAMRTILRYAFTELNLHRVTLTVFEYNPRAIRSYEKAGFVHEGRVRDFLHRDGNRCDLIFMGILREEWENQAYQEQG